MLFEIGKNIFLYIKEIYTLISLSFDTVPSNGFYFHLPLYVYRLRGNINIDYGEIE